MKDKEKQIEEMAKETRNKQWQKRDEYCLRIQKAMQYKGNCDHEDVPSILVDYEEEIKKELIPENNVVLSREEYEDLQVGKDFNYGYHKGYKNTEAYYENFKLPEERKETAEKIFTEAIAKIKERFEQTKGYTTCYDIVFALTELAKQHGVEIKE